MGIGGLSGNGVNHVFSVALWIPRPGGEAIEAKGLHKARVLAKPQSTKGNTEFPYIVQQTVIKTDGFRIPSLCLRWPGPVELKPKFSMLIAL